MPHSSPQADWNLAHEATQRLLSSAEEVVFSYARQSANTETRPSRLALRLLGAPKTAPQVSQQTHRDRTESFSDTSRVPFPHSALRGGAGILTSQSNCPFLAFATGRLATEAFEPAASGLNARQRGILLHNLLHRVWAGAERGGISTHSELLQLPSLREFVAGHVWRTMRECFDATRKNALPDRFPARYLELESERLTRLVVEWLEYERKRVPFAVANTEVDSEITVAGLSLKLRLDRIDTVSHLQGQSAALVIDYKSSDVGPRVWAGARPENV
jgi:ATP-dependent helicase/DNAse subunit B